ncbi:MAG: DNA polymerase III subunit delta [Clostridia bacterium]|nr:DNA polymerase III subunit delta [Clostridia bacterium]MBP5649101.1 DNA polymerase III subunit delta [Clostridia bacterium]
MNIKELKNEINGGEISPVYILTGSDEFVKNMAIARIKTIVKNYPDLNFSSFAASEVNEALETLDTMPFGDDYRVVVIEGLKSYSPLSSYISNPSSESVLIIREDASLTNKKADSTASAGVKTIECNPLTGKDLLIWLAYEAKSYNASLEEDAGILLSDYCKQDMFRMQGEIRKLASLKVGGIITKADITKYVTPDIEFSVWKLSDEIAAKNTTEAIRIYKGMDDGRPDTKIMAFGAIYGHFRRLFYASVTRSDEQLAAYLQIKPYMVSKVRASARKMSTESLRRILEFLADYDEASKNGGIPLQCSGEMLVIGAINAL